MDLVILCDTSVLVPALLLEHPLHERSLSLLQKISKGELRGAVCVHSLAECYSTLTALPFTFAIPPSQVLGLIEGHLLKLFETVDLNRNDYQNALKRVAKENLRSAVIYNALIFQAALKMKAKSLMTWDPKDFERISQGELQILTPDAVP